jgi:hypothetical protein
LTRAGPGPDRALWGLLCGVLIVNFLAMPALRYDGDAIAWEMEAESLAYRGNLAVRPSIPANLPPGVPYFAFNPETGYWYSKYGIGNTLIYSLPLLFERIVLSGSPTTGSSGIFGESGGTAFRITRRVELFNAFNLLLSLLLAFVLYRLASLFTATGWVRVVYVASCFYTTYLWNYLRAHSSQIYQCLFFSLALLFLFRFVRRMREAGPGAASSLDGSRDLLWSLLSLVALCLVKLAYLPLLGVFGIAVLLAQQRPGESPPAAMMRSLTRNWRVYLGYALPPALLLIAILLAVNDLKFGSPFKMGYERDTNLFGGDLGKSIPGYLIHPRYSIFIHFPVLIVALFGIPRFWRSRRFELLVILAAFLVMFSINANYVFWMGEAAVGPRYLLFALPALSLPMIPVLERIPGLQPIPARIGFVVGLLLLLGASGVAQLRINALEFHAFFRLRTHFLSDPAVDRRLFAYFRDINTAQFNAELMRYGETGELPPYLRDARKRMSVDQFERLEGRVRAHLKRNYYF